MSQWLDPSVIYGAKCAVAGLLVAVTAVYVYVGDSPDTQNIATAKTFRYATTIAALLIATNFVVIIPNSDIGSVATAVNCLATILISLSFFMRMRFIFL